MIKKYEILNTSLDTVVCLLALAITCRDLTKENPVFPLLLYPICWMVVGHRLYSNANNINSYFNRVKIENYFQKIDELTNQFENSSDEEKVNLLDNGLIDTNFNIKGCEISKKLIKEPVKIIDGAVPRYYEKKNLFKWLEQSNADPMTGEFMTTNSDKIIHNCPEYKKYILKLSIALDKIDISRNDIRKNYTL